jgi:hypothetical protein
MSSAGTVTPAPRRGDTRPPGPVLLLSESAGLAAVLGRLLEREDQLTRLGSLRELAARETFAGVEAVVVDAPRVGRSAALEHLRERYAGPLVVLVESGAGPVSLLPNEELTILHRPFSADDLGAALGFPPLEQRRRRASSRPLAGPGAAPAATPPAAPAGKDADLDAPPLWAGEDAGWVGPAAGPIAQDVAAAASLKATPPSPPRPGGWPAGMRHVGRGRRQAELLLAELAHGWRTRRWVRVAGFSAVSALAFAIAFALAATQSGCGQGCGELGAGVAPPPTYPLDLPGTPTTSAHAPGATSGAAPGSGDFKDAASGAASLTASTKAQASTTNRPAAGGGTTRPSTTRQTTTTTRQTTTTTIDPTTTTTVVP